jgi:hypothetical protein
VARHIFQACSVWIYTQSNIIQASYTLVVMLKSWKCLIPLRRCNSLRNSWPTSTSLKFSFCRELPMPTNNTTMSIQIAVIFILLISRAVKEIKELLN